MVEINEHIAHKIKTWIQEAIEHLSLLSVEFSVEHPEEYAHGDYSTNVAMVLAKTANTNPRELAEKIVQEITSHSPAYMEKVEVAGGGFINFYLTRDFFVQSVQEINNSKKIGINSIYREKKIMVEYTDPNPFKPFHIGHLMTNAIGESISRILEHSGAEVRRANYQGDVGLHVAKAFYGMQKNGMPEDMNAQVEVLARYIGECYVLGSDAYESDRSAKEEIDSLNKKIYTRTDKEINKLYDWGLGVTMKAFENLYKILGTEFTYYFLESNMAPIGEAIVRGNLGDVFEESEGAIVFKAENYDSKLHTRVFITKAGLPTYETKELGLIEEKFRMFPEMDVSLVITANEQLEYMKVVSKAISIFHPELEKKMKHIVHGMMRLSGGKMSSRKGNIVTGESLIRDTISEITKKIQNRDFNSDEAKIISEVVGVAAIKYSILRSKAGSDIIYNMEQSISTEGDSGPYLQYSYARARSILHKAKNEGVQGSVTAPTSEVTDVEKILCRFPEVVARCATEFQPHYLCTYLIELARAFNNFYSNSVIIDAQDTTSSYKVAVTEAFSRTMKEGLELLGIKAPEKM